MGIRNLFILNRAALLQTAWSIVDSTSVWRTFVKKRFEFFLASWSCLPSLFLFGMV